MTGIRIRPAEPADDAFLDHVRTPEILGRFNSFDDPPDQRVSSVTLGVGRVVVVLDDGTPIGDLGWIGVPYGPNRRSVAWKIGITILPEYRGRGYGAGAQRLLADHLFATTLANRVEADTDVENIAEQRALERAGFRREGILRGAQYRDGGWHDLVVYARLRGDG